MKVKNGDIIDFLAISWEKQDFPTVVLQPIKEYYEDGIFCEEIFSNIAEDLIDGKEINDNNNICEYFKTHVLEDIWKTKVLEVVKQKIEFYNNEDNVLDYKILETIKI